MAVNRDGILATGGGTTVRVEGLSKTLRALEKSGAAADDLRDGIQRIGNILVQYATPRAPRQSGALAGSIRAGRGKTKAVVRMGGARFPYAAVVHYGWAARNISPQPVLVDALKDQQSQIFTALDDEITKIMQKNNLT